MSRRPTYKTPEEKQAALRDNWRRSKEAHKERDKAKREGKKAVTRTAEMQLQELMKVPGPPSRRSMLVLLCRLQKGA